MSLGVVLRWRGTYVILVIDRALQVDHHTLRGVLQRFPFTQSSSNRRWLGVSLHKFLIGFIADVNSIADLGASRSFAPRPQLINLAVRDVPEIQPIIQQVRTPNPPLGDPLDLLDPLFALFSPLLPPLHCLNLSRTKKHAQRS
jgi:hypothetical protein